MTQPRDQYTGKQQCRDVGPARNMLPIQRAQQCDSRHRIQHVAPRALAGQGKADEESDDQQQQQLFFITKFAAAFEQHETQRDDRKGQ